MSGIDDLDDFGCNGDCDLCDTPCDAAYDDEDDEEDSGFLGSMLEAQLVKDGRRICSVCGKELRTILGIKVEAVISKQDSRAEIWFYVFGRYSFPLKDAELRDLGEVVGKGYLGDAFALKPDERERLIEKMTTKFGILREEITKPLDSGVIPIKADGVTINYPDGKPCEAEEHQAFKRLFEARCQIGLHDLKTRGYD